jgi:hypothetical protein
MAQFGEKGSNGRAFPSCSVGMFFDPRDYRIHPAFSPLFAVSLCYAHSPRFIIRL